MLLWRIRTCHFLIIFLIFTSTILRKFLRLFVYIPLFPLPKSVLVINYRALQMKEVHDICDQQQWVVGDGGKGEETDFNMDVEPCMFIYTPNFWNWSIVIIYRSFAQNCSYMGIG